MHVYSGANAVADLEVGEGRRQLGKGYAEQRNYIDFRVERQMKNRGEGGPGDAVSDAAYLYAFREGEVLESRRQPSERPDEVAISSETEGRRQHAHSKTSKLGQVGGGEPVRPGREGRTDVDVDEG